MLCRDCPPCRPSGPQLARRLLFPRGAFGLPPPRSALGWGLALPLLPCPCPHPRSAPGQGLPPPTHQHLSQCSGPTPSSQAWPVPPWGPPGTPQGRLCPPISAPPCAARLHGRHPTFVLSPSAYITCPSPRGPCGPGVAPTVGLVLASPSPLDSRSPQGLGEPAPGLGLEALPHRSWGSRWSQLQGPTGGLGAVSLSSEAFRGRVPMQATPAPRRVPGWG